MLVDSAILVKFGGGSEIRRKTILQDVAIAANARHAIQSVLRVRTTSFEHTNLYFAVDGASWWFR
jgi:hypothetical protein